VEQQKSDANLKNLVHEDTIAADAKKIMALDTAVRCGI
jgi:hypothetical protein